MVWVLIRICLPSFRISVRRTCRPQHDLATEIAKEAPQAVVHSMSHALSELIAQAVTLCLRQASIRNSMRSPTLSARHYPDRGIIPKAGRVQTNA